MTYRTEQDRINRREANRRYYRLEENKQQKRDYMKEYNKRPYVIAKRHEKYLRRIIREASNENLHAINTERFINYEKEKTQ